VPRRKKKRRSFKKKEKGGKEGGFGQNSKTTFQKKLIDLQKSSISFPSFHGRKKKGGGKKMLQCQKR